MKKFGVDLSKWNGKVDFEKLKNSGVEFVILRCGYASIGNRNKYAKDPMFEEYYAAAKSVGLDVGTYFYSMLNGPITGKQEAEYIYSLIKDKQFEYPVWLDVENTKNLGTNSKEGITTGVETCLEYLKEKGFYVGIYTGKYIIRDYMIQDRIDKYDIWIAQWSKSCDYNGNLCMWQFGGETNQLRDVKIEGVSSASTDQNYCYKDYPNIIKSQGLNGYPKTNTTPSDNNSNKNDSWILRLQKELNNQGFRDSSNKKLVEDDIAGPRTLSACPTVRKGARGNITKLIQGKVNVKADGIFGKDTYNAVKKYQTDNKLSVDGIVGKNTWRKLLGL